MRVCVCGGGPGWGKKNPSGCCFYSLPYRLKILGPFGAWDVSQVATVFDFIMSDFLILNPHDEIPEFGLICTAQYTITQCYSKFAAQC